ncbi:MAG: hypothetical protein C4567_05195 [Deltaproteobacteria bacterium]|nr:MAG: hypothetical protein C4567_05195 [Deltaproteobacteria bacterium]
MPAGGPSPVFTELLLNLDEDLLRRGGTEGLIKVMRDLIKALKASYSDLAEAVNISPEYEKKGEQPLPAEGRVLFWEKSAPAPGEPAVKQLYNNGGVVEELNRTASDGQQGLVELATAGEAQAMSDAGRAVTPANLAAVRATDVEAQAKAQDKRFLTPKNLAALGATETLAGLAERATDAEAAAGTDAERFVTPAQLWNQGPKIKYAKLWEQQSAGTDGGDFTSGDEAGKWGRQRVLNQEYDPAGIVALSGNQFTLGAGTYRLRVRAPANNVTNHKTALVDVSAPAASVLDGTSELTGYSATLQTDSKIVGEITVSSETTYEIRHRAANTKNADGLGVAADMGKPEIYTEVEIWKAA